MCDFTQLKYKISAYSFFKDTPPWRVLPQNILNPFPYAFESGLCPVCGRPRERKPAGKNTERSMCRMCYENLIANRVSERCFICGWILPNSKIDEQRRNPREIVEHMHDGICTHIWTIIHNVSVGDPDMVSHYALPAPKPQLRVPDLSAEHERIPAQNEYQKLPSFTTYKGKEVKILE